MNVKNSKYMQIFLIAFYSNIQFNLNSNSNIQFNLNLNSNIQFNLNLNSNSNSNTFFTRYLLSHEYEFTAE